MRLLILKIVLQIFVFFSAWLVYRLDYVTYDKRTRVFKISRRNLLTISVFFLVLSIVVLVLDDLDKRDEIQKLVHPISDVSVSYGIDIPLLHSSLESYRERFQSGMNKAISEFPISQSLPHGLSIGNSDSINVLPSSLLFPNSSSDKIAYYLINYVGLNVKFYKGYKEFSSSLKDPDLSFNLYTSIDGNPSNSRLRQYYGDASLRYNLSGRQLSVHIWNNKPPPEFWENNRKITSIPDLEKSLMAIKFFGYMLINYPELYDLEDARHAVTVGSVVFKISGQEFRFLQPTFQQHQLDNGTRVYTVRFDKAR
jgi:hypothetical protein